MKRILIFSLLVVFGVCKLSAQDAPTTPVLLNYDVLAKKVEKSNDQIQDEKKAGKSKTWIKRGQLFQDVYNQGLEQVQIGMGATELKLFYKDPVTPPEVNEDNVEVYKYQTMNYYFENGRLRGWSRNNPISKNPLDQAFSSYKKGLDLIEQDKQMKTLEKLKPNFDELKNQFRKNGQNKYYLKDYEGSLHSFESFLDVDKLPVYEGVIDTFMINYCGIVAREIGRLNNDSTMYRKAIDYYNQLADLGYGGSSTYIQLTRDYYAIGDTLGAIHDLMKGLKQYPDSSILVTVIAQAYYLLDKNEEGLAFVDQRIKDKPDGPAAYYWKGLLLTNEDDVDQATIDSALHYYEKSLEIDPSNGQVWYQTGYVYYALGANYFELESYEENEQARNDYNAKGVENYEKAVTDLEKAYELSENDKMILKESLDLLKRIYYKLYGEEDSRYQDVINRLNNF